VFEELGSARPNGARSRAPSRREVNPAALELIERYGPSILRTARRYAQSPEDAEDAYQRGLEILLTKAPSTAEEELLPWLKTVIKHEAFALRRQRERNAPGSDEELAAAPAGTTTDEQAEQRERLQVGAEAMARLKPQEVRCLILLAEGFSYREICEETGFTYTKVNRSLTEGRRSFSDRVRDIEAGAECERLLPKLSGLADGEVTAAEAKMLRRHLRGCPACRLVLGEYRSAPGRVAALVPPAMVAADSATAGALPSAVSNVAGWVQERVTTLAVKLQTTLEMTSANKVAAVTASTAAIAGGGVGAVATIERTSEPEDRVAQRADPKPSTRADPEPRTRGRSAQPAAERRTRETRRRRAVARAARVRRASKARAAASTTTSAPRAVARSESPSAGGASSSEFGTASRIEGGGSSSSSPRSSSSTSSEFGPSTRQSSPRTSSSSASSGSTSSGGEFSAGP